MWYHDAWRLSVSISCVVRNIDVCNGFSTWFYVTHFKWALIIFHWSFTWFHISYESNLEVDIEYVTFDTKTNGFFQIWTKFLQECACLSGTITTTMWKISKTKHGRKDWFSDQLNQMPSYLFHVFEISSNCWNDYSENNWTDWKQT